MEYSSIAETAKKWNITSRRVQVLCVNGRIPGAERVGHIWIIPRMAEKPEDARIRSGRYIGFVRRKAEEKG